MSETSDSSGVRPGTQLPVPIDLVINKTTDINTENQLPVLNHNMADVERNRIREQSVPVPIPDIVGPPQRYNPPSVSTTPKPFQRISGIVMKQKPNENRIHFPSDAYNDQRVDSVISQPLLTDTSPLTSRPSKPIASVGSQSQPNKFRLKPGPAMPQMSSQSPLGSAQKPNLRLPPFLLHNHNSGNTHPTHTGTRHKPNTPSVPRPEDSANKIDSNHSNSESLAANKNNTSLNSNHSSDFLTSESNTRNNSVAVELIQSATPVN